MRLSKAETANSTAMIIVTVNSPFSIPRRVWKAELKLSLPPKAPPTCAPVLCKRMAATRRTDRMI